MSFSVSIATDKHEWDSFLLAQSYKPFLQSWTMGDVYSDVGQTPIRLVVKDDANALVGICMALLVPARRGRHLSIPYGPVVSTLDALPPLFEMLKKEALSHRCSFIRVSPFIPVEKEHEWKQAVAGTGTHLIHSPMHLLGEHLWMLPLMKPSAADANACVMKTEEEILADMRKTTRNLVRRAERDGITVEASKNPNEDIHHFLKLHDETRKRHHFTPYTNSFFRAQVKRFSETGNCTVYLAWHEGKVLATSIHMHFGGETSYHHGASIQSSLPVSYALQWKAITDALRRNDHLYNFWGIAPEGVKNHPFAGVTLFKTGFGGQLRELMHCTDIPLSKTYHLTRAFEIVRKWKRGF